MDDMGNGWDRSALAWIEAMGEGGDFGRVHVLDAPMMARVRAQPFKTALDVGCGEGRFCRMLAREGLDMTGVEPTDALRATAQHRDPAGRYVSASAERLPFEDGQFDLVVSYLSLIDIAGLDDAIAEMARVLRPSGSLLIANLNSFNTAGGWVRPENAEPYFAIDNYLEERAIWQSWRGISIKNWHRPLGRYMSLLLAAGLRLVHYEEPRAIGGEPDKVARYNRSPYLNLMEWRKD